MLKRLSLKSDVVKYVLVLMSGTVMAQLIAYVFAPVITRLYTPEEVGELGLFIRIVSLGAALATARYEQAFPVVKTDQHSFRLYLFAVRIAVVVSIVSILLVIVPALIARDVNSVLFFSLIPIGIFSLAVYNIGTNWSIRMKLFRIISYSKITNVLTSSAIKVGFGFLKLGSTGLLFAMIIGQVLSNFWFVKDFFMTKKNYNIKSKSPRNYLLAKQYKDFPTINLPHVLVDLGKDLLVAVLILQLFSKGDYGLYDHSYRMLRLPLIFIGLAIGQVLFQQSAERLNRGQAVTPLLLKSVKTLVIFSVIPFGIVFFFGEELFTFVFGDKWGLSGRYSEIMSIWFMVNLISSPISSLPNVLRKQKEFFILGLISAGIMITSIAVPPLFHATVETTLWILSGSQAAYQLFVIYMVFRYARRADLNHLS